MDESYPLKKKACVDKKTLEKMEKKYGPIEKNFMKEGNTKINSAKNVNIGNLSDKQLKDKLENVEIKNGAKKKNNRNGKAGINKHNNYTPNKYAPRKTC